MMELHAFLRNLPAFEAFNDTHLHALMAALQVEDCPDGYVFIHQGESNGAMFMILSGTVGVIRADAPGETRYAVRELRDGEVFGLLSLIDDMPAAATCVAQGAVTIAALTREAFDSLVEQAPPIAHQLRYMIAVQLARDLQEQSEFLRRRMAGQ
ncbi:cyclic nucleotide-binding domain-containing protein [Chitinimonas sp.]|uniref:cyclic nucleotide-binding domain-containing protein n=1 Tax=Chitinimonas sp. TaxID=1934313 RepID=UPI0035AF5931